MFYIYIDAYFSSELIILNFLHISVLPDAACSVDPDVMLSFIMLFICDVPPSLTTALYIILCYKLSFVFF